MKNTILKWHSIYECLPELKADIVGFECVPVFVICEGCESILPSLYSRHGFNTYHDTVSGEHNGEDAWDDVLYWAYRPSAKEVLNELAK